jgi:hypothetical protein
MKKKLNIYAGYSVNSATEMNENIIIEHTLRYEDINPIKEIIRKYGTEKCKSVWEKTLIPDKRLEKLNYFLARFIFNISDNDNEIKNYLSQHNKRVCKIICVNGNSH